MENNNNIISSFKRFFIGKGRDPHDPTTFHKVSLIAFFAWVGLGSDGLSSSCYGPSEVMVILQSHPYLALIVAIATVITIIIVSSSYSQIIELFPSGGGGYLVASKLLSPFFGMVSGSALLIDYLLTITVSVASGADALFSFLPLSWHVYRLPFAMICIAGLTILNMRGVRESVMPLVPIFLIFIFTHLFAILYSFGYNFFEFPVILSKASGDFHVSLNQLGFFGLLFFIMHAYSMGAGTYTGIEAVSNGLPILRDPKVATAKRTMKYMAISLSLTVFGLMVSYLLFNVSHKPGQTLNAVLFNTLSGNWNPTLSYTFVIITLISEAAILIVAAQTGFIDGPRVLSNMALDRWVPTRFASLSDRLVTQNGIVLMGTAAFLLMFFSGGAVSFLLVLYSINVFMTFSMSQLGMVIHWWQSRGTEKKWFKKLTINGIGLILTFFILVMVMILKFNDGGWITILITGTLIVLLLLIKKHYNNVGKLIKKVDSLVEIMESEEIQMLPKTDRKAVYDRKSRTAVLLVNGFTGLGLHSLMSIFKLFGETFKNFAFMQVGVIDAGVFKGVKEIEELESKMKSDLDKYVVLLNNNGYYAESFATSGLDVVESIDKLVAQVLEKFPNSIFFGGQIVFKNDTIFSRWLHNHTVFAVQRKLYHLGIQFVILPIKV